MISRVELKNKKKLVNLGEFCEMVIRYKVVFVFVAFLLFELEKLKNMGEWRKE